MEREAPRELPALTAARFFAAFAVVIFHFGAPLVGALHKALPVPVLFLPLDWCVACGGLGVSFFFVLSGFILTHVYRGPIDRRRFWSARFARIYPVYLAGFLLVGPFFVQAKLRIGLSLPTIAASGASALALLHAWISTWVPIWNFPSWSVAVEAFFYALFPFLAPRLANLARSRRILLVGAIWIAGMSVPVLYLLSNGFSADNGFLDNAPIVHLHEFIVGILAGTIFIESKGLSSGRADLLTIIGIALVAFALPLRTYLPYLLFHDGLLAPPFALIIYGLASGGRIGAALSGRGLHTLGDASYALYSLQAPVYSMAVAAMTALAPGVLYGPHGTYVLDAVTIVGAVAIALPAARFIERPARRWIMARLVTSSARDRSTSALAPPAHAP